MYKNIGQKLQTVAKVVAWIGIIFFGLVGLAATIYGALENVQYFFNGLFILLFGPLGCWISSLTLYGFGKLVEDNEAMRADINEIKNK